MLQEKDLMDQNDRLKDRECYDNKDANCNICLEEFNFLQESQGMQVFALEKCPHVFHRNCLLEHLKTNVANLFYFIYIYIYLFGSLFIIKNHLHQFIYTDIITTD